MEEDIYRRTYVMNTTDQNNRFENELKRLDAKIFSNNKIDVSYFFNKKNFPIKIEFNSVLINVFLLRYPNYIYRDTYEEILDLENNIYYLEYEYFHKNSNIKDVRDRGEYFDIVIFGILIPESFIKNITFSKIKKSMRIHLNFE
jgi:hypothetical protein